MVRDPPHDSYNWFPGTGEDGIQHLTLNLETMYLNDGSSPLGIQSLINHVVSFCFCFIKYPMTTENPLAHSALLGVKQPTQQPGTLVCSPPRLSLRVV